MNSRTALALVTAAGLALTGVASANAASSSSSDGSSSGASKTTVTSTTTTSPTTTPTTTYPVTTTATVTGTDGVTTVVESVILEPTTVTHTPPKPTDLSSRLVEASSLSERGQMIFAILGAVMTSVTILIEVAGFVLATNPELLDQVRDALGVEAEGEA